VSAITQAARENGSACFSFLQVRPFLGVVLIVAAILFKKFASPVPDGWPWYWIVPVGAGFVPEMSFFPTARLVINWRAFILTMFFIVLISLLWEATLAVPYGWWGYQPRQMMGVFIGAWAGLPLEAVCVWIAVSYGTVIAFEVLKLWQASGKSVRWAFHRQVASGGMTW